jgi:DNA-binding CsgD family transcriptional regulator
MQRGVPVFKKFHQKCGYKTDALTVAEQRVMKWVSFGKSNQEIGLILGLSPATVKGHVERILEKTQAANRTHAVAIFGMPWLFERER